MSAAKAHDILEAITPPEIRVAMHVGLIRLGREICKPGRPRCEICPLVDICPTAPTILGTKGERA
jgi:endonuclease III